MGVLANVTLVCWVSATSAYTLYRAAILLSEHYQKYQRQTPQKQKPQRKHQRPENQKISHPKQQSLPQATSSQVGPSPATSSQAVPSQSLTHTTTESEPHSSPVLPLNLFKQAIAHAASGLLICDAQQPDMPIVYVSPSFEALTGYSKEEIIGKNCRFLQGKNTYQIGINTIRKAIASGTGCKVLLQNYHKDGRAFWNEVTLSPIKNEQGVVTHYVGTQVDISHYLETFKALQESESRYRHLYEETPAMLHSVNPQGRIVSVSHHWLEKLGYQQHEVIGQPLTSFVAAEHREKVAAILSNLQANNVCRDKLCQLVKKNGDRMDVLLSTIAECQENNEAGSSCDGSSLGVLVDITERKKAKERLRRSEALLRAINNLPPTGIFVMDCHTDEALFINSEFYKIWQLEHLQETVMRGELSGEQLLTECLSNIDLGAFVATSTAQDFTAGNKIVEDEVPLLDGRTLRRIYGPIQEENSTFAYLYVFEDITERKQAVKKLAQATQAAEAANRAKSEFLANMSHELRSPLNAILGFTHILQSSNPSLEQQENLDIIFNSGEHLLALINDILDISKIEAGCTILNESEFDLYRLLDELQQVFQRPVREKGLQLIAERSPQLPRIIYSDRLKLRQILINLLSNAVKFTQTGTITLSASVLETNPHSSIELESPQPSSGQDNTTTSSQLLHFAVTDTGTGIAPADQSRLFEAFVQTESGLTACEGTGLGLTISYEYVQLLGGELTVQSAPGEGSTFSFSLPVQPVNNTLTQLAIAPPHDTGRIVGLAANQKVHKILVVDDVALNRKLLTHLLNNVGFDVREAVNGKDAVEQWQAWQPDLIWMDMRMPVMNGEEATRRIKALAGPDNTPRLIALTASVFNDNKAAAIDSGCDDFVSKPIQAHEIFDKITQHLGVKYQYEPIEPLPSGPTANPDRDEPPIEPLTAKLLSQASTQWQEALTQATLDLDDAAILALAEQLPAEQQPLAQAIEHCVETLAYKKLLQVLQETEAVSPCNPPSS